jgi:hypothetical protein
MRLVLLCLVLVGCGSSPPASAPAVTSTASSDGRVPPVQTGPCVGLDEAACDASGACHAEFAVPKRFLWCQPGKLVSCAKPEAACDEPDPKCATLGDFKVQWVGDCSQDCVRSTSCQP